VKTILIVDDASDIRDLVAVTLQFGPYRVLQAVSGPEAIHLARREHPHLILLDIVLAEGGMDGLEVCRQLRAHEETRHSSIILLTARYHEGDVEAGYAAGADDYIAKPFRPLNLITRVLKVLGDSEQPSRSEATVITDGLCSHR
jgi:DNA-binding response OmpR family regulator